MAAVLPSGRVVPPSHPRLDRLQRLAVGLLLLGVGLVVGRATVTYAQVSDPFGTLLVSKAIATHGTIRLDVLGLADLVPRLDYRLFERGGHQYYVYPLGTPLIATPFVAVAGAFGMDVTEYGTEVRLQHWLVVACAVCTAWLSLRLARRLLPFWPALACTGAFWAGTSLASAAGAALWSHNLAVACALLAIDVVVAAELSRAPVRWAPLGLLLFLGYLVRPTMAVFAVVTLGWAAVRDRAGAMKAAVAIGAGLALFAVFSWREFGELLPPYYRMGLQSSPFSGEALAGLLISPSRGLLPFSPLLLAVWATRPLAVRTWPLSAGWWLVALAWPVALVLALSRWGMWWGGGCYGPRLLTDALPGLFLLTLRAWPVVRPSGATWLAVGVLGASTLFSAYVHVAQGLYNPWTIRWNVEPSVDTDPWSRFNWRFPQFLHDRTRHQARLVAYFSRHRPLHDLPPVQPGETLRADAPQIDPLGFDRMRGEGRWTLLHVAELLFSSDGRRSDLRELTLTYRTNGSQTLRVELNDIGLFEGRVESPSHAALTLSLPEGSVQPGLNRLRFVVDEPKRMRRGDPKSYGIAVKAIGFR